MKTQIKKDGNMTVVNFEGKLDFETQIPLRDSLSKLIRPVPLSSTASASAPSTPTRKAKPKKAASSAATASHSSMPEAAPGTATDHSATSTDASASAPSEPDDRAPRKIIFNLEKLEFVGSSGIASFVQTLREFNASAPSQPLYCNVRSEFKRVFKAFGDADQFEFLDSLDDAVAKVATGSADPSQTNVQSSESSQDFTQPGRSKTPC